MPLTPLTEDERAQLIADQERDKETPGSIESFRREISERLKSLQDAIQNLSSLKGTGWRSVFNRSWNASVSSAINTLQQELIAKLKIVDACLVDEASLDSKAKQHILRNISSDLSSTILAQITSLRTVASNSAREGFFSRFLNFV